MKHIAIIGSTGSTGKELIRLALEADYRVTAVERAPTTDRSPANLKVLKGDVTDLESLIAALQGVDYAISCFGPSHHKKVGTLMSEGTTNIVKACESNGLERLVFMSGFVQSNGEEFSWFNRWAIKLLRRYYSESYEDKVIAEAAVQQSTLEWVIVRAVALDHSRPTGKYIAGFRKRVAPFRALSYADCARCLLDTVEENSWTGQIINVGKA